MGLSSGPQTASEGPLSLLQHASPSRLLYSLMICENLFDRDMDEADQMDVRMVTASMEPDDDNDNNGAAASDPEDDEEWETLPPGFDGSGVVEGQGFVGGGGGGGGVGGAAEFRRSGGGGAGRVVLGRATWRDRFVSSGGLDTLVELLLSRDWDAVKGGEAQGTVGILLACLALLLTLLERFIDSYLPRPPQLMRLVRRGNVFFFCMVMVMA